MLKSITREKRHFIDNELLVKKNTKILRDTKQEKEIHHSVCVTQKVDARRA